MKSIVGSPDGITYLDVSLRAGDRWIYTPPAGHTVLWIGPHAGHLATPEQVPAGELIVLEEGNKPVEFEAITDTGFLAAPSVISFSSVAQHLFIPCTRTPTSKPEYLW